ncbi:MAG: helix-turn-helix transcriptional regulator [Cyanobacteria bacterium P01_A01_bin.15]
MKVRKKSAVAFVDEGFLKRLGEVVHEIRGDQSQRQFARTMQVSQSTVQQWENGRNVPSLENLEKIARLKGMLVEDFIAYLYGRSHGPTRTDIMARIGVMKAEDFGQILHIIGDRLAPPPEEKPPGKPKAKSKKTSAGKVRVPLTLELSKRTEMNSGG